MIFRKGGQMRRKKQKRNAFTLVELLVVIIIISLLAGFVAPKMLSRVGRAKADLARPKMAVIESAIERFGLDCGQYPDDSMGLDALLGPPAGLEERWNGPYLKPSQLEDPWGNPYIYVAEGEINPGSYDLVSLGADGVEGGEGDNADIFNE
jgi:general secretion pathway protein G